MQNIVTNKIHVPLGPLRHNALFPTIRLTGTLCVHQTYRVQITYLMIITLFDKYKCWTLEHSKKWE